MKKKNTILQHFIQIFQTVVKRTKKEIEAIVLNFKQTHLCVLNSPGAYLAYLFLDVEMHRVTRCCQTSLQQQTCTARLKEACTSKIAFSTFFPKAFFPP